MILTSKRLLVDTFFTCGLSKSLAFWEFKSFNWSPALIDSKNITKPKFVAECKWLLLVLIKALTVYLIVVFFRSGNYVRVGGEYQLIRFFINVFSSRTTGFHREEKLIDLTIILYNKTWVAHDSTFQYFLFIWRHSVLTTLAEKMSIFSQNN